MVVFYIHPKETLREDTCLHSHCGGIWGPGETSTHRSEIEPPLLTFGHRAVRMGGPARTLCPPGKEKSRISFYRFWKKEKKTQSFQAVYLEEIKPHTLCGYTHTQSAHTTCPRFCENGSALSPSFLKCSWATKVFHFLLWFVRNRWDVELGGNVLERSHLSAIHIPGDGDLVKAATITIVIMRTVWINNGRDKSQSNVWPGPTPSHRTV